MKLQLLLGCLLLVVVSVSCYARRSRWQQNQDGGPRSLQRDSSSQRGNRYFGPRQNRNRGTERQRPIASRINATAAGVWLGPERLSGVDEQDGVTCNLTEIRLEQEGGGSVWERPLANVNFNLTGEENGTFSNVSAYRVPLNATFKDGLFLGQDMILFQKEGNVDFDGTMKNTLEGEARFSQVISNIPNCTMDRRVSLGMQCLGRKRSAPGERQKGGEEDSFDLGERAKLSFLKKYKCGDNWKNLTDSDIQKGSNGTFSIRFNCCNATLEYDGTSIDPGVDPLEIKDNGGTSASYIYPCIVQMVAVMAAYLIH